MMRPLHGGGQDLNPGCVGSVGREAPSGSLPLLSLYPLSQKTKTQKQNKQQHQKPSLCAPIVYQVTSDVFIVSASCHCHESNP